MPTDRRTTRPLLALVGLAVLFLFGLTGFGATAHAGADDDPADDPADDIAEEVEPEHGESEIGADHVGGVQGVLTFQSDDPDVPGRVPVEGAEIAVFAAELSRDDDVVTIVEIGEELGRVTTGEDGNWRIGLPTPGEYVIQLEIDSLPEGVLLLTGESERAVVLAPNQSGRQIFQLGGAETAEHQGDPFYERASRSAVAGLQFGLIIGMCAVGLSLVFGTTGLVNFAHSEMIVFGAVVTWWLNTGASLHLLIAAPIAVLIGGFAGVGLDLGIWRPLRRRGTGLIAMMLVSIGLAITLRFLFLYFFRDRRRAFEQYSVQFDPLFVLGPIRMIPRDLVIIVVSTAALVAVGLILQFTKYGKAMRAVSDNPDLAASTGIDVNRVITGVWFSAGVLVTLGGVFQGMTAQVHYLMGFNLLLLVFAAVILGGLGTAFGAMFGGIIIGLTIELLPVFIPPGWEDPLISSELKNIGALATMILILMVRPNGLFGRRERIG